MAGPDYAPCLAEVSKLMLGELARWRSVEIDRLWSLTQAQLQRRGKQLRPLLSLTMTDYLGGQPHAVIPAAAGVELYHVASLVLDDVQDHSLIRRGEPTVNVSAGPNIAVITALFVRSLSYHMVNRYDGHECAEQLRIHQELDHAATLLILGQSIDLGWHEHWYMSHRDFPYEKMIEGKSGALFGCAAAVGACVSQADPRVIGAARDYGIALGALYQLVDDYLDVFGDERALRRPKFDDFREGKMTAPVIGLLTALEDQGNGREVERVLTRLAAGSSDTDRAWLLDLMRHHDVAGKLRGEISERAARLADPAIRPGQGGCTTGFDRLLDLIVPPGCRR